ncbi:MAG: Flp1 family type IVb pilin [Pseudobdellovibrionaceae bacterium]|nr:Flp1 family type IVb pilin [Pseudobdellovibrionaceae bacterium]
MVRELKKKWKNGLSQRGQGMTEYILLVVVIIALVSIFRDPIVNAIRTKMGQVQSDITGFKGE